MTCACKLSGNQIIALPKELNPRFLSGLTEAEISSILSFAKHRYLRASSIVTNQDDPADRFFILTSGRGRYFFITDEGRKINLLWLTAGQIFGGATMISPPSRYLATTEIATDGCALVWERKVVRDLLLRYPKLFDNALSIMATDYLTGLISANISLNADDANGRIAHLLVSLASGIGKITPGGVEVSITNEELANYTNVTHFTVSRSLSDWERAGLLTKQRGKIVLRKPERLLVH
ncbi:Crp/Fnr family transcriptional regulator [Alloacidobacterium sp.]|uniref:Crp/Fnr family transcriptional regulator n=1 Tax=Alloacidobacterium sp. TaxID=2951999 RepID=UPI002D4907C5|nr:Crp/Fnr family transcriptional regulator [Alloacidobacterium sp.]HYK37682.1 Crp/Fnr family transcriptional regulator [Alloacidobacterium sp.]